MQKYVDDDGDEINESEFRDSFSKGAGGSWDFDGEHGGDFSVKISPTPVAKSDEFDARSYCNDQPGWASAWNGGSPVTWLFQTNQEQLRSHFGKALEDADSSGRLQAHVAESSGRALRK